MKPTLMKDNTYHKMNNTNVTDYSPKVLICENDDLIRQVIVNQIQTAVNGEIYEACDGKVASKILALRNFDLVITNLFLPVCSGLEIIELIRNTLNKNTPVILLSSDNQEQTMTQAYELGADDFVKKPYSPVELNLRSRYLINRSLNY
jgi:DNA-binding response OmpR family regulator